MGPGVGVGVGGGCLTVPGGWYPGGLRMECGVPVVVGGLVVPGGWLVGGLLIGCEVAVELGLGPRGGKLIMPGKLMEIFGPV